MHFSAYTTTVLMTSLATAAFAIEPTPIRMAPTKRSTAAVSDMTFLSDSDNICSQIYLEAAVSDTSKTYYGGMAYSTTVDGEYQMLTNGELYVDKDKKIVTFGSSLQGWAATMGNITLPKDGDDVYEFGIITVGKPIDASTTIKDKKITSGSDSYDVTDSSVFLSIPSFPPSTSDIAAKKMYKVTTSCAYDSDSGTQTSGVVTGGNTAS